MTEKEFREFAYEQMDLLRTEICQMRQQRDVALRERDEALRERDEARRGWCRGLALESYHAAQFIGGQCAFTADEIALERDWDCFQKKVHNA